MVTGGVEHHPDEFDEPAEGGGVTSHGALTGRDAADGHPTSAITGLDAALATIPDEAQVALIAQVFGG